MARDLEFSIVAGEVAPQHAGGIELDIEDVVITEQGAGGLPLVDLKLRGPNDEIYFAAITGRLVIGIAAAVKGINQRLHGRPEL